MTTARERMKQLSGLVGDYVAREHFLAIVKGSLISRYSLKLYIIKTVLSFIDPLKSFGLVSIAAKHIQVNNVKINPSSTAKIVVANHYDNALKIKISKSFFATDHTADIVVEGQQQITKIIIPNDKLSHFEIG